MSRQAQRKNSAAGKMKITAVLEFNAITFVCEGTVYIIIIIIIINFIIGIRPLGRSRQRPELSQATGMVLVRCILDKFLWVVCHCFPLRLDVPTSATRCPHVRHDTRDPSGGRWNCGREYCPVIFAEMTTSTPFRDLLHAANLRHGTDGFTSPPNEVVLRIFSPLKTRRLRSETDNKIIFNQYPKVGLKRFSK
jgi:hypothetical protein